MSTLITEVHLSKPAYIYVRQSTLAQETGTSRGWAVVKRRTDACPRCEESLSMTQNTRRAVL